MVLKFGDVCLEVTPQSVSDVFGIPIGGTSVMSLPDIDRDDLCLAAWRKDYPDFPKKPLRAGDLARKIIDSKITNFHFKQKFLMLFANTMGSSLSNGTFLPHFLFKLNEEVIVENLDWCGFIFDCLKKYTDAWKKDKKQHYHGPITFLIVSYSLFFFFFLNK